MSEEGEQQVGFVTQTSNSSGCFLAGLALSVWWKVKLTLLI